MFFWRKKSTEIPDLSWLAADMHAHLLPGIDDGAPDIETSVEMIRGLAALGYQKLIATPHILGDIYPNTPDIIRGKLAEVRTALQDAGINVALDAAAEYFIDDHFEDLLREKAPLLTLKDNYVLVEFSMVTAPYELQQVFFEMQIQDYQPVLAHPERYIYLDRRREIFDTLKDAGCLFQLNMLSLTGHYGRSVKELAEYLLEKGYYNFLGTDLHHPRHLALLQKLATSPTLHAFRDYPLLNKNLL
ncbi:tyrosine-protein phosphatase [Pseudocnuella soli]|uniref:tyrosine-protein phosphatase n=1 Tax=Pseudocnuella soli TaxID=2502779 RepID=UPI001F009DDC|nr:CpsB/CapC family capsule biosynthesis tyrosine phosphatase [Pseudocnuella soli]